MPKKPTTIIEYINAAPNRAKSKLREMRTLLKKAAPGAKEEIKWSAPTYSYERILFTFAAFKQHIGFYPTPRAVSKFTKELKDYKTGKGSIQFPLDEPLPKTLITKIAKFRVKDLKDNDAKWM